MDAQIYAHLFLVLISGSNLLSLGINFVTFAVDRSFFMKN